MQLGLPNDPPLLAWSLTRQSKMHYSSSKIPSMSNIPIPHLIRPYPSQVPLPVSCNVRSLPSHSLNFCWCPLPGLMTEVNSSDDRSTLLHSTPYDDHGLPGSNEANSSPYLAAPLFLLWSLMENLLSDPSRLLAGSNLKSDRYSTSTRVICCRED